jgi:hypothetical protein
VQVVILLLLVAALALLVLGLTTASSALVVVSIAVSLVAVVAIVRARQRRIARLTAEAAEKRRLEKIEKDKDETTKVLAAALSKSRVGSTAGSSPAKESPGGAPKHRAGVVGSAVTEPSSEAAMPPADAVPETTEDPSAARTRPPLTKHGADPVWVIDGRPRYHSWNCDFIHGRSSESVPLAQAVEDGFTPCALCDPDTKLAG